MPRSLPAIAPPTLDVLMIDAGDPLAPESRARADRGSGLVVLASGGWHPDVLALTAGRGITVGLTEPERGPLRADPGAAGLTDQDLLTRVGEAEGTRTADLLPGPGAAALLRSPSGAVAVALADTPAGRTVVVALEDSGTPGLSELVHNAVTWVEIGRAHV